MVGPGDPLCPPVHPGSSPVSCSPIASFVSPRERSQPQSFETIYGHHQKIKIIGLRRLSWCSAIQHAARTTLHTILFKKILPGGKQGTNNLANNWQKVRAITRQRKRPSQFARAPSHHEGTSPTWLLYFQYVLLETNCQRKLRCIACRHK